MKNIANEKKTIGILGGMGPEATSLFFHKIIQKTKADKDQDHIRIIIYNDPVIPDRTDAILGIGISPVTTAMSGIKFLEASHVDFITIPCVTLHYFYDEIIDSLSVPVLSIVTETLNHIKIEYPDIKRIGILATTGTYKGRIFEKEFHQENYDIMTPDDKAKNNLMDAIYGSDGIKAGYTTGDAKERIIHVANDLIKKGAELIVGGCTEIPIVIKPGDLSVPFIDTLSVLADSAILKSGHKLKKTLIV